MPTNSQLEPMRDHWWWRPGWRVGRSFYTWHITFDDQAALAELAEHYAPLLRRLAVLDAVPNRWLHLTMQGIGFTDDVRRAEVDAIVAAARRRCADLRPFALTLGPVRLDAEALGLAVRAVDPLTKVRDAIRAAIGDVWSLGNVPEPAENFHPHVTLGYSNAAGAAEPIAQALEEFNGDYTCEVDVSAASLIELNRDQKMYVWEDVARAPLG